MASDAGKLDSGHWRIGASTWCYFQYNKCDMYTSDHCKQISLNYFNLIHKAVEYCPSPTTKETRSFLWKVPHITNRKGDSYV